jgi:hypothetical protein
MTDLAQHSSASVEHYTPPDVVEAARRLMGGIDLDPATSLTANTVVRAESIYTMTTDGLSILHPWHGRVFLNPPGKMPGRTRSLAPAFWQRLVSEYAMGNVTQAVFVCFSLEQLQQFQGCQPSPLRFPFCVPRKRLAFHTQQPDGSLRAQKGPTHANAVIYLSPREGWSHSDFREAFASIGECVIPALV